MAGMEACQGNFYTNQKTEACKPHIKIFSEQMNGILNLDMSADCWGGVNGTWPGMVIKCWNTKYLNEYFNLPATYQAFHVSNNFLTYTHTWQTCSTFIGKHYTTIPKSTIPELTVLYNAGIRLLIMNGDMVSFS